MSARPDFVSAWADACDRADSPSDALIMLADAIAFGLNEGDFLSAAVHERIEESFLTLHLAKHRGRAQ